jgi:hypothetical protein
MAFSSLPPFQIKNTVDQTMLQVAVIIGELIGRYLNDWIMEFSIRRNKGVHEAESRLWCVTFIF